MHQTVPNIRLKDANLSKNTIGLDAQQVKAMAKKILDNWK